MCEKCTEGLQIQSLMLAAKAAGLSDKSYNTVVYGRTAEWQGNVTFTHSGATWIAEGLSPKGDAYGITRRGGIQFRRATCGTPPRRPQWS